MFSDQLLRFNIYLKWDSELDIIINSHLHLSREWMWCYCGKVICYQAMRTHVYMIGNTCSRWWWYFLTRDTKIMCVHFSNFYDLTKIPCKSSLESYHAICDRILSICAQCTRLLLFYDLPVPAINVWMVVPLHYLSNPFVLRFSIFVAQESEIRMKFILMSDVVLS